MQIYSQSQRSRTSWETIIEFMENLYKFTTIWSVMSRKIKRSSRINHPTQTTLSYQNTICGHPVFRKFYWSVRFPVWCTIKFWCNFTVADGIVGRNYRNATTKYVINELLTHTLTPKVFVLMVTPPNRLWCSYEPINVLVDTHMWKLCCWAIINR